ncbi:MAG: IS1634 family transposase [Burkholderiaceae bacterium]|nr:IS1634 family transposase [Burkholderiaceae bacterium]
MRRDLRIRKTRTASGATAVQVVRYENKRRTVVKHIGSARDEGTLVVLLSEADRYIQAHDAQPSLWTDAEPQSQLVDLSKVRLVGVTHAYARRALLVCADLCGLSDLPVLYRDLALMRIIEPASKLQTVELLEQYFEVSYAERTVYRLLPKLIAHKAAIETAAIDLVGRDLKESFSLVLYDVTTLYFESFKEYDFQRPGFSKDNKPQQPQIVIGLITTRSGFPVMHEVFEGNTFEGHTMLAILKRFQQRVGEHCKPVIVADAAMLSTSNMQTLDEQGYRYIVGARLANSAKTFVDQIEAQLPRTDGALARFKHTLSKGALKTEVDVICHYSDVRYKKDRREFDKQVARALALLERNEPGRRAKFVKKADDKKLFEFNTGLKAKAEQLLGIKGYVTNIAQSELSNQEIVDYYHDLWHIEQAFRMSKSDLQTRPIFHRTEDAIRSHVLVCFMALMMGKYLEIKTGASIKQIRKQLWKVHEAHLLNEITGKTHIVQMDARQLGNPQLIDLLEPTKPH